MLLRCLLTHCFPMQVMGYLSGTSPHIKSGAVSVLSVLIYKDADIFCSMPDLVPSLLCLLQGKSVEVIKVSVLTRAKIAVFLMTFLILKD